MAARAIWKGVIGFGTMKVPVKLYSAINERGVHFRLLHAKDKSPVRQHMVDPESGEIVENAQVKKGYPVSRGLFVILDDEELEKLEPKESRDIEITRFVDPREIDHRWYERAYYLGPDNSSEDYAALAAALEKKKKEGVAHWVMRGSSYVGALRAEEGHLMLITLRHAEEVVAVEDLEAPSGRALDKREVSMAQQLVAALEDEFRPDEFKDEYRARVMDLVETKARGGKPKVKVFRPRKTKDTSLADTLQASLKSMNRKGAARG